MGLSKIGGLQRLGRGFVGGVSQIVSTSGVTTAWVEGGRQYYSWTGSGNLVVETSDVSFPNKRDRNKPNYIGQNVGLGNTSFNWLMCAGGGGAGSGHPGGAGYGNGGGGGAGGIYMNSPDIYSDPNAVDKLRAADVTEYRGTTNSGSKQVTYSVSIGAGGGYQAKGGNTSIDVPALVGVGTTADGGGGGGSYTTATNSVGGSGGGRNAYVSLFPVITAGNAPTNPAQGNAGGSASYVSYSTGKGSGGGGKITAGISGYSAPGTGVGGQGFDVTLNGLSYKFGGGGSGAGRDGIAGPPHGSGWPAIADGVAPPAGGGGVGSPGVSDGQGWGAGAGGTRALPTGSGGSGGDGIVIISFDNGVGHSHLI